MGCEFDKCCGCIDLRTGCLIIGYLSLIGDIIFVILMALGLLAGTVVQVNAENESQQAGGSIMMVVFGIGLVLFVIFLAFTIVLLVGLHQNRAKHIKVYLVYATIMMVLFFISILASFAGEIVAVDIVKNIFYLLVQIYFLLVIRSYYLKLKDSSKRGGAIYNTA